MITREGCPKLQVSMMWEFVDINKNFIGTYLIFCGAYYLLYSIEYYKILAAFYTIQSTFTFTLFAIFYFVVR